MFNIRFHTIPSEKQRYRTVGDWFFFRGELTAIAVSEMGNKDYEMLVGIHELIEAYLCERREVTEEEVNAFDIEYETARDEHRAAACGCVPDETSEPGDDKHAPYYDEHHFATEIEKQIAIKMGVDWDKYDEAVNAL